MGVDKFLTYAGLKRPITGAPSQDQVNSAVDAYLTRNPVEPGATEAEAAQIEANRTAIENLDTELAGKQPVGNYVKTVNGVVPDETGNVVIATGGGGPGVVIDPTLTQEGQAADAKAVGDAISALSGENVDLSSILETVPDNNLLDTTALETQFVNADGTTVTGNFSNYIPIKLGHRYVTNIGHTQYHWFDTNKNHLSTESYQGNPQVITPAQSGYLLLRLPTDYSAVMVLEGTDIGAYRPAYQRLKDDFLRNPWRGKRWLCVGDSITTDTGVYADTGYGKLISRELEMKLHNIALNGRTMAWGYEALDGCAEDYDLITVMLGTNDHGYVCSIGSLNDDAYTEGNYNGSFYARTQLLVEKMKQRYPKSLIMMLTPIKRAATGESANNDDDGYQLNNTLELTTKAYRDAVIAVCEYYSIPCVDLYNTIDPRTEADRELYFMSADDGTHPNDLGHALYLAPIIKDAILRHTPYVFPEWETDEPTDPDTPDVPDEPGGETTEAVLIHAYGTGVGGETLEDTVGDCDMTAKDNLHGVHSNEGTWNLTRGESFSIKTKLTRNTIYYHVDHFLHTGGRGGMHTLAGNSPYDMTGRLMIELNKLADSSAAFGDAVLQFYYFTEHSSSAKSAPIYGTSAVAKGDTVEYALTWDADTSTVRLYQAGVLIGEEVTSVPLAVDGLVVRSNYTGNDTSPCEYIELYRGVITV